MITKYFQLLLLITLMVCNSIQVDPIKEVKLLDNLSSDNKNNENLKEQQLQPTTNEVQIIKPQNVTSAAKGNVDGDLQPASSVTSVHHQVWTSSSSGSLDELSPEIISKLRSDVPFLAAYALRPRLVGASLKDVDVPDLHNNNNNQPTQYVETSSIINNNQPLPTLTKRNDLIAQQSSKKITSTTSAKQQAQREPINLIPKLGDFSELAIETSSTSKSEHHHKRKTSLKRQEKQQQELGSLRKKVLATTSRLMKKRRRRLTNNSPATKLSSIKNNSKNNRSNNKRTALVRSQIRTGRLRRKMNNKNLQHHMSIIRHGLRLQETTKGGADDNELEQATKGGSNRNKDKKPFYSKKNKPDQKEGKPVVTTEEEDQRISGNDIERNRNNIEPTKVEEVDRTEDDDVVGDDEEEEDQFAKQPEPKRVGDDDVEEDGDTVTVMPKFDGVDDDPDIDNLGGPVEDNDINPVEREQPEDDGGRPQNDPNVKRVNREKPNQGGDKTSSDGGESVLGGGIGVTNGGGGTGSSSPNQGNMSDDDGDGDSTPEDDRPNENKSTSRGQSESGVEFAGEENGIGTATGGNSIGDSKTTNRSQGDEGGDEERNGKRKKDGSRGDDDIGDDDDIKRNRKPNINDNDDSLDVDYRDEMKINDDSTKRTTTKKKHDSKDCEDGSYNHHNDHHDHHHDHHNSIKWLQDAIPGEPNVDYPILSRINSTNFNCRDQKYPGFYADVESRCQVFHICQSDGRQDSFLCPNGTIFSQLSTVCVWWNSFDCEDAPKYYDLNALLYKKTTSASSPKNTNNVVDDQGIIKPRDKSLGSDADDGDDDSINDLIESMRRRSMTEMSRGTSDGSSSADADEEAANDKFDGRKKQTNIEDQDEATIQRKSTNIAKADGGDNDYADENNQSSPARGTSSSSRLRGSNGNELHRRERRASARQAPPKLKSRRVSRYSRRRKLRHGVKPKRRA